MSTVVEGLVLAIKSLPKEDKTKVMNNLLEDKDISEVVAGFVTRRLVNPIVHSEEKHTSHAVGLLGINGTFKERGRLIRESYVAKLEQKGIHIKHVDKVWAKTPSRWVGIPFATERRPNRWFLGLPENKVLERIHNDGVVVVLLCQPMSGPVLDFIFPPSKLQEIVNLLSKSKGQLKFNVKRVGNRYFLVLPRHSTLDISAYKDNLSVLQN